MRALYVVEYRESAESNDWQPDRSSVYMQERYAKARADSINARRTFDQYRVRKYVPAQGRKS